MVLFSKIKKKLQVYFYGSKQRKPRRLTLINDLDSAKSVGILFDYNKAQERNFAVDFAENLAGNQKKIQLLGFCTSRKDPNFVEPESFFPKIVPQICTSGDFGLRKIFKSGALKRFASYDFDILVDLTPKDFYLIKILVGLSSAKFKTGFYEDKFENIFDLMIREPEGASNQEKLEHLKHYLKIINSTRNENKI